MRKSRDAVVFLLVVLAVIVLASVAGGLVQRKIHTVEALTKRPDRGEELEAWHKLGQDSEVQSPTPQPSDSAIDSAKADGFTTPLESWLLVVGASYGRRGIHPRVYDEILFDGERRTARWWCEATSPVTWNVVLRDPKNMPTSVKHVVLLVSPNFTRYPSSIKDIALRHVLPFSEFDTVLSTLQLDDASEMMLSRTLPLYQSRRGGREKLLSSALNPLGLADAPHLPHPLKFDWYGWSSDELEVSGIRSIASWLVASGRTVTLAEWPMSSRLRPSVHAVVESHFRPLMRELASETGATWIPQRDGHAWNFVDAVHPDGGQGAAISAFIAKQLKQLATFTHQAPVTSGGSK